jgi:heme oxygenase
MLSERLKLETAAEHEALEQEMMPLLRGANSVKSYAQLLQGMYRFLAPLEQQAHQKIDIDTLPDLESRRGTHWMAKDLQALGEEALSAGNSEVPEVLSGADAWGAFYLLEGSTLGGQMITKILQKQLPEEARQLAYFGGYGAQTGSMWKAFKYHLNLFGETQPEQQEAVVRFARTAFNEFKKSLSAYKQTL